MDWDRPDPERLGRLPDLEPHPPGPQPRRHPRQRGHLPRAVDRREVEPHARSGWSASSSSSVATSSSAWTTAPMRTRPRPSRNAPSSGRCAGRAAAGTSSTASRRRTRDADRAAHLRGRPGRWHRAAATGVRRGAGTRSASTATASADGRSTPTAPCSPIRCAGSPSRFRRGTEARARASAAPDHVVTAFALGYSIFDCALPTRDARHGRLYAFRPGWADRRPQPGDHFYRAVRIHDPRLPRRPRADRGRLRLPALRAPLRGLPAPPLQGRRPVGRAPRHAPQPALLRPPVRPACAARRARRPGRDPPGRACRGSRRGPAPGAR